MHAPPARTFQPTGRRVLPEWAQYAFLSAVIISSGNPITSVWGAETPWLVLAAVAGAVALYTGIKPNSGIYLVIVPLSIISVVHVGQFGVNVAAASVGFLIKLAVAAVCALAVQDFGIKFVRIMTVLAAMSLVFFLPILIGFDTVALLAPVALPVGELNLATVGIHTLNFTAGGPRNSGMFWEPGAFAGYLALALLFYATKRKSARISITAVAVIVVALLTTSSTTGYAALAPIALLVAANASIRSETPLGPALAVLGSIFLLFAFVAIGTDVDFLGAKIISQWESSMSGVRGSETTRFGNLFFDMRYLSERPLTGWSASPQPRFGGSAAIAALIEAQGNGLSGFAVRYGLLGAFIAMLGVFFGMLRWASSITAALACVCIITIILFGEQFFNYPAFLCLFFLRPPLVDRPRLSTFRQIMGRTVPAPCAAKPRGDRS